MNLTRMAGDQSLPSSPRGRAGSPPAAVFVGVGALASMVAWQAGSATTPRMIAMLGGLAGAAALVCIIAFARHRLVDLVFLGWTALISIPVDTYWQYQEHAGGWPGIRVAAPDAALILLIGLTLLGLIMGRVTLRFPRMILVIYGLLLVQYVLSMVGAPRKDLALFEFVAALHAIVVALIAASLFRRKHLVTLVLLIGLQVCLHTGFAAAQFATGRPIGANLVGGPDELIIEELLTGSARPRPFGLFSHPITFADFLLMSLPLLAAGAFAARRLWQQLAFSAMAFVGAAGLALTLSRGAWISALCAGGLFLMLGLRYRLLGARHLRVVMVVSLVVVVVGGVLYGPQIYERLTQSEPGNLRVRFELNDIAFRMIADHPVTGVGLNNFTATAEAYDPKNVWSYFPAPVHNMYLLETSEAGLPAGILFLMLFGAIAVSALRRLPGADRLGQWIAVGLLAALGGLLVSQLADFSYRIEPLRSISWFYIGLMFGALRWRALSMPRAGGTA